MALRGKAAECGKVGFRRELRQKSGEGKTSQGQRGQEQGEKSEI